MELKDIKRINQDIYRLDDKISRDSKVVFIAAIVICATRNKDFLNPNKRDNLINFNDENTKPIDQIINLAEKELNSLNLQKSTLNSVKDSFRTIRGVNTKLNSKSNEFHTFINNFLSKDFPNIKPTDLFFERLYMEIDKKASKSDLGTVLTPVFAAQLMVDLAEIDYKKDVVVDLCSGTGLFSLLSYSKMLSDMNKDLNNNIISKAEYRQFELKLFNSIIANDSDSKMVTLCLANFLLKSLNSNLIYSKDVLLMEKSDFKIDGNKIQATKAILNPPYEDSFNPVDIIKKNIELVKDRNSNNKVVAIVPPQKFGKNNKVLAEILNISTLECVIKMQENLFKESGKSQSASIFVFNTFKSHSQDDIVRYFDFTDTGYVYLKDSGLVDKNHTFEQKKEVLLNKIKNGLNENETNQFVRTWNNFYEVNKELEIEARINPNKIKESKEDADITLENTMIKKMLNEKKDLILKAKNNFVDNDGSFEKYIIDILSED